MQVSFGLPTGFAGVADSGGSGLNEAAVVAESFSAAVELRGEKAFLVEYDTIV